MDFDSIEIYRSPLSGDADDHFKIEGFDKDEDTDWLQSMPPSTMSSVLIYASMMMTILLLVPRTLKYVIDSYEYLTYGQGDLGNMFYVTTLDHGEHDIHEVEVVSGQALDNPNLAGSADIFYHGHHTDFDRSAEMLTNG